MKLLLDQGLPRSAVLYLRAAGIEADHVGDIGLAEAMDSAILDLSREQHSVVVTLDADFHTLLALSGAAGPSVIRIRIEGLRAAPLVELIAGVLRICADDLTEGAMVSVTETAIRVRRLPLVRIND